MVKMVRTSEKHVCLWMEALSYTNTNYKGKNIFKTSTLIFTAYVYNKKIKNAVIPNSTHT